MQLLGNEKLQTVMNGLWQLLPEVYPKDKDVVMVTRVGINMTRVERKYLLRKRFKGQELEMEKMCRFVHGQSLRRMSLRHSWIKNVYQSN